MSDCNVCFYGGEPDGYCEVWNRKLVKSSRKEFKCCECRRVIPIGSGYESTFTVYEGSAETFRTCLVCVEIRDTFHCGTDKGQPLLGELWEHIADSDFYSNMTSACFGKLKTDEARAYLRYRWMRWKGLSQR